MKEESIIELLNHVQLLETKRLQKVDEERKRGEWFNVFNVLGMSTDEVRTHSRFIAELLNPQGSHGCGDEFLKAFIKVIPSLNGFDIETAKAMRQVMDQSNASILQQLRLDESDWSDMVAEQREMITNLQRELDKYIEISRILLSENLDLRDFIGDYNIEDSGYKYVDLDYLFSEFAADDGGDSDEAE